MWGYFLTGVAMVLVFEGLLPFLSPRNWRVMMIRMATFRNPTLRWMGFLSMVAGAALMFLVHSGIFD